MRLTVRNGTWGGQASLRSMTSGLPARQLGVCRVKALKCHEDCGLTNYSTSAARRVSIAPNDHRGRLSKLWIPSLIARKADDYATAPVSDLLLRCGFLHQTHPGIFNTLPLGMRVQEKLERLIDHHMGTIGASKTSLSSLSTPKLWRQTDRYHTVFKELFKFKDRHENRFILSPTHEEEMTILVRSHINSAKDLPLRLYQISRKYRDEMRPREGLLRAREFLMKDLYTFDLSAEQARDTYKSVRAAYDSFFNTLGLPYLVVKAETGAMGGQASHEYQMLSENGEDSVIICQSCSYAANVEFLSERQRESVDTEIACPSCKTGKAQKKRTIEVGHTFNLGSRYSRPLKLELSAPAASLSADQPNSQVKTVDIKPPLFKQPLEMGCHGIGISRLIAATAMAYRTKTGLGWPIAIAPFEAVIIAKAGLEDVANSIYDTVAGKEGSRSEHDCVIDDRTSGFVMNLKDAEILGWPIVIVVGRTWQEDPTVVEVHCPALQIKEPIRVNKLRQAVGELKKRLLADRLPTTG